MPLTCKLVFYTQMLLVGTIVCLPTLGSYPPKGCLYSPINQGNILESICSSFSAWGQSVLVWFPLLMEARALVLYRGCVKWGASPFSGWGALQVGNTLEILSL